MAKQAKTLPRTFTDLDLDDLFEDASVRDLIESERPDYGHETSEESEQEELGRILHSSVHQRRPRRTPRY